jgi:hypothetical protein
MQNIIEFFNHPLIVIIGGFSTILMILGSLYAFYLYSTGILPVLERIGMGLAKREIAIFADSENILNLKNLLLDSKIFKEKNISLIDKNSIKKAENITLLLVHWKSFKDEIDDILAIKKDTDALIIYAPQQDGMIDKEDMKKINEHRNTIVVNFRGRLLNDILVSMMTTSYK